MVKADTENSTLFLLDGMALAYRSYFAFIRNPLINSKGINTSGVYGFTATLLRILKDEKPDYMAVVFDTSAPTFRHEKYPEYKATREKMPDDLREQLPVIRTMVEAFSIPILEKEGFEADDIIGTLAKCAEARGMNVMMVTGDKDFMQLVTDNVKMYSLKRNEGEAEITDIKGVIAKIGLPPEKVIDYLGLMGDSSDNVPGVPGVGPKTARNLIGQFGSMEAALDRADEAKGKSIQEKLKVHRDQALLSRELVTIHLDVPMDCVIEDLKAQEPDKESLTALFNSLEFTRFHEDLAKLTGHMKPARARYYQIVRSEAELDCFAAMLQKSDMFSFDLETTAREPMAARIVGLSFAWKPHEAWYIPVMAPELDGSDLFTQSKADDRLERILDRLKPTLEDAKIRKCGQNIKYDMLVLKRNGVHVRGADFDSMVAAYLVDPSARQYNLDALSLQYLNLRKIPTTDIIGTGRNQITMDRAPLDKVAEYACEDADAALQLRIVLEPRLEHDLMTPLFREVEMPLVSVLMEMEENGVFLDTEMLACMSGDMRKQLDDIQSEIFRIAGEEFNINSTQQLATILFEKLKVHELLGGRRPRRNKTGYSTDVRVLETYASHPLPKAMLDYRQLTKLKSTYVDALPKLMLPETGRVHASFNQTVAATGRLSTSNPNLQNIPIRTELGREIRKAFIPQQNGWKLLSADYSQIELRLMAHLSGDDTLLESFRNGEDVHRRTASEILNIPVDDITDDHRRQAKTINFGIMYGMGAYGLASRLSIPNDQAQAFITAYFARYPRVNEYITQTIALAHKQGFVTTLLNRRRYLPELKSDNRNIRDFGERTAVNTPIQGTAADMIKIAMIRIAEQLKKKAWKSRMILQIHDELLFEAPEEELNRLEEMVVTEMEGALQLDVPIKVEAGIGETWFDAH